MKIVSRFFRDNGHVLNTDSNELSNSELDFLYRIEEKIVISHDYG